MHWTKINLFSFFTYTINLCSFPSLFTAAGEKGGESYSNKQSFYYAWKGGWAAWWRFLYTPPHTRAQTRTSWLAEPITSPLVGVHAKWAPAQSGSTGCPPACISGSCSDRKSIQKQPHGVVSLPEGRGTVSAPVGRSAPRSLLAHLWHKHGWEQMAEQEEQPIAGRSLTGQAVALARLLHHECTSLLRLYVSDQSSHSFCLAHAGHSVWDAPLPVIWSFL